MHKLLTDFQNKYQTPAVGAALIIVRGGTDIAVVGTRTRDKEGPVTIEDQWHIGSCGKAITAALYARLVERGDTEWGMPLAVLFADFTGQIDPAWKERTIDELLVCRAGMRANLTRFEMRASWQSAAPLPEQRTNVSMAALAETPGRRGRFVYSNLGYIVAGAAIERITGVSFEDALRIHIFQPLGITSEGFGPPPHIWGHKPWLRIGPLAIGKGAPGDPADLYSDNPPVMNSAGCLHLTLADWGRFHRAFLISGGDLLQARSIEHLLKVPDGRGVPMAMGWVRVTGLANVSYGMQGSNSLWSAVGLVNSARTRTALVVCNDGRSRVLQGTVALAASLLDSTGT